MILLCGIPSEVTLAMVATELTRLAKGPIVFNQRRFASAQISFSVERAGVIGSLDIDAAKYRLEDFEAVYARLMDDRFLPELEREAEDSELRRHCRTFHGALTEWQQVAPCRVVNRPASMASNSSKPFQALLALQCGLNVPETVVTNDPELVRTFAGQHSGVVYKSISGVRSIVSALGVDDLDRLEAIRWCPVQFQEYIQGHDVRVHVIGDDAIATLIKSEAVDYRYATRQGYSEPRLEPYDLAADVASACVRLTRNTGLTFAGVDLRFGSDGVFYFLEVNPSPAFSYYEVRTGQPIAAALARHLAGVSMG